MKFPPDEHAMVQGLIDETYAKFTNVVADGPRAGPPEKRQRRQGAGRQLDGFRGRPRAFRQTGAGPRLRGSTRRFRRRGEQRGKNREHRPDANLVEYRERYDISNFLSMFGQSSQAHDIKLDLGTGHSEIAGRGALFSLAAAEELK